MRYAITVPVILDPMDPAPVLFALPPGSQDEALVEQGLGLYWADEGPRRGWIVVSPAAPTGTSFHAAGAELAPWFDEQLENDTYGNTRGSGVLVRQGEVWRIRQ